MIISLSSQFYPIQNGGKTVETRPQVDNGGETVHNPALKKGTPDGQKKKGSDPL